MKTAAWDSGGNGVASVVDAHSNSREPVSHCCSDPKSGICKPQPYSEYGNDEGFALLIPEQASLVAQKNTMLAFVLMPPRR